MNGFWSLYNRMYERYLDTLHSVKDTNEELAERRKHIKIKRLRNALNFNQLNSKYKLCDRVLCCSGDHKYYIEVKKDYR